MKNDFTYDDFITGEKFQSLADFEYLPNSELPKKDYIIYCKTDHLKFCVPEIEKSSNTYILISHNSDGNIVRENPREFDFLYTEFPRNLKMWFAQNSSIDDKRIIQLPLGLENSYNYLAEYKKELILQKIQSGEIFKPRQKLLYINLNIETNPKERQPFYDLFQTNDWCTVEQGKNGQGFENYLNQILNHKYVLSIFGNGFDTHRFYEGKYLGAGIITKRGFYNEEFFDRFPFIDFISAEHIKEFCEKYKEGLMAENCCHPYVYENRLEPLKFSYWKNLITNN